MPAKAATPARRQPGSLRLVTKRARGKEYRSWQWRTRRRDGDQHRTFDVELGGKLTGLRTRTLIALGDLSAPLLLERWCRWHFKPWRELPAFAGQPAAARSIQRSAWWLEIPRTVGGAVKLRLRSIDGSHDYRYRRHRAAITRAEQTATTIWQQLTDDPIVRLAQLRWFESEMERCLADVQEELVELRRALKRGDLTKRDHDADERSAYARLERWEHVLSTVRTRWDEHHQAIRDALPRTTRDALMSQVIAKAEKLQSDPKQLNAWRSEHWQDRTLHWS
jgi:hypothetical protein